MFNGQFRKIKVIQVMEKEFLDYNFQILILNEQDVLVQFLIYGVDNIQIDNISNKYYKLDKELNLAYFEGITTKETFLEHGLINYSKIINYQIYKYIPEFRKKEKEIILNKNNNKENSVIILGIYKNIVFTEYGQLIDELYKIKLINFKEGTSLSIYSLGLMLDTKYEVDLVELNGKKTEYSTENSLIKINNVGAPNNQFAEIHMKYKYLTNLDKNLLRKESIITLNTKNSYCKIIVVIPDNYVVISSNEYFQKDLVNNNIYFFNGISNEEKLSEYFRFCFKKGSWVIYKEITLKSDYIIEQAILEMNRIFKGGNLKENIFEVINENGEFNDDEKQNKFIFIFTDLKTNKKTIRLFLIVENTTSDYQFIEKKELLTIIPEEDKNIF